ncbi:restriction endonuclease subunit S [Enterobacter cloacae]|uniref:restriction endonuclease subunit S n=1 Tax=Enterobacter cloacae TaxID=550 RepID=UPI002FF54CED
MSEWMEIAFKDACSFSYGKMPKKEKIGHGSFQIFTGYKYLDSYPEYNCDQGDVIVVARGVGGSGDVKIVNKKSYLTNLSIKFTLNNEILLNTYCFYYFQWNNLRYLDSGSAQSQITINDLEKVILKLPSRPEQKAIASVLSSLDDKIDLLHRQNKTLESMAETLFRQWFDVDSNDEWQEKNVLDIFTLVGGGTPKTSVAEYWTDEIPWISGGDISAAHQGYLYSTEKSISLAGLQNSSAKLLPKNSTVISARGTVGKYALLARDMAFSQSNYGIISKIGSYPFFIYLLVGFIVDDLLTAAYGSVFDTITTRTFESVNLKFPSLNSIEKFNEEISPIFSKKETNTQQIKSLETLRDTLLPKLMSGEVRVQYAEEKLESVA